PRAPHLRLRRPPCPPLFPYTTLFRSGQHGHEPDQGCDQLRAVAAADPGPRHDGRLLVPPAGPWRPRPAGAVGRERPAPRPCRPRSEEHTSELQSRENLVCRLLLEKKK